MKKLNQNSKHQTKQNPHLANINLVFTNLLDLASKQPVANIAEWLPIVTSLKTNMTESTRELRQYDNYDSSIFVGLKKRTFQQLDEIEQIILEMIPEEMHKENSLSREFDKIEGKLDNLSLAKDELLVIALIMLTRFKNRLSINHYFEPYELSNIISTTLNPIIRAKNTLTQRDICWIISISKQMVGKNAYTLEQLAIKYNVPFNSLSSRFSEVTDDYQSLKLLKRKQSGNNPNDQKTKMDFERIESKINYRQIRRELTTVFEYFKSNKKYSFANKTMELLNILD